MAFMISRETENVQSSTEVENAFRALTSGEKPYITSQELYAVSNTEILIPLLHSLVLVCFQIKYNVNLFHRRMARINGYPVGCSTSD